ncbi:MAG TPA: TonB-dependent receptor [Vicinamibacteria bacterium]|nr:TonB-dependent receptor [Vicinamibacteria bacterium]
MTHAARSRNAVVIAFSLLAPSAWAANNDGGVMGWVEDPGGAPVAGALISLFGRGTGGGGLVTLSDSTGRFFLPSLPAGSYTVRAMGRNKLAAPARQITVLPNRDFSFTVALQPETEIKVEEKDDSEVASSDTQSARRERNWLMRHKRRSVLEAREQDTGFEQTWTVPAPSRLLASWIPDLGGTVEVMATPPGPWTETVSGDLPSTSVVRLKGRIAGSGRWALGGLVSESESTAWRMAAEFVTEPVEGHELQVGTGYGTRFVRPLIAAEDRLHDRSVGAVFAQDRWQVGETVTASVGTRFSYIGFLDDAHHVDPSASIEVKRDDHTRLMASVATRTLAPGGDLLTLSTLANGPAFTYAEMDQGVRAERSVHVELAMAQAFGATTVRAHTFYENVRDQLANAFQTTDVAAVPTLHILNAGGVEARGMGLSVGHHFGRYVNGEVTYTYGRAWRAVPLDGAEMVEAVPILAFREGDFHDVVARLETVISDTDTRVVALYRLNQLSYGEQAAIARRFDVQLSQGLPFLGALTRADWDVLVAVRNLYYEPGEGAMLDEQAVSNPPKRVLGGIAVRF